MTTGIRSEQVAIREEGEGIPVVLLHGSGGDSRQWRSVTGYLAHRYRMIAPDLPGYGASRHVANSRAPSLRELAETLGPLIREGHSVHLVGHSFGGAVALKAACLFPGPAA